MLPSGTSLSQCWAIISPQWSQGKTEEVVRRSEVLLAGGIDQDAPVLTKYVMGRLA